MEWKTVSGQWAGTCALAPSSKFEPCEDLMTEVAATDCRVCYDDGCNYSAGKSAEPEMKTRSIFNKLLAGLMFLGALTCCAIALCCYYLPKKNMCCLLRPRSCREYRNKDDCCKQPVEEHDSCDVGDACAGDSHCNFDTNACGGPYGDSYFDIDINSCGDNSLDSEISEICR